MLLREAELRVAVGVVERADRGEDLGVVGQRRARGELRRELDRAIRFEDRYELAPADPAFRVDVVEEDLVRLLLVRLDRIDELRDAREVDHHDADLDLRRAHAGAEQGVRRNGRCIRRRRLRSAGTRAAAAVA